MTTENNTRATDSRKEKEELYEMARRREDGAGKCCLNPVRVFRKKTCINGTHQIRVQCKECGRSIPTQYPHHYFAARGAQLHPLDERANVEYWEKVRSDEAESRFMERKNAEIERRITEDAKWRMRYHDHLNSDEWAEKRQAVLRRDPVCGRCQWRPSKQVHHLTYRNLGDEPLTDLEGICSPCHYRLHKGEETAE